MTILMRSKQRPTCVMCIREVRVGISRERLDECRRFYVDWLALKPWPDELQIPGGWGLGDPQCGLFLEFRHDPRIDRVRRRFTVLFDDLNVLRGLFDENAWPHEVIRGFGWTDQYLLVNDPIGHLIEVRQSLPL